MARYSPELLAVLRHRYEDTDQPMHSIAAEFKIGITTLQTLVRKECWSKRSQRKRDCPPATALIDNVIALTAMRDGDPAAAPDLPAGTMREGPDAAPLPAPAIAGGAGALSAIERIEALILKEIGAEEAARERLQQAPRAQGEAERCARTLSILTQTLQSLQRMRAGSAPALAEAEPYDDPPADIDAFREHLARKIEAFMESRGDDEDAFAE